MLRVLGILVLIALYVSFIVDVVRTPRADARALPKLLWLGLVTSIVGAVEITLIAVGADPTIVATIGGAWGATIGAIILLVANPPPTLNPGDTLNVTTPAGQPTAVTTVATPPRADQPPVTCSAFHRSVPVPPDRRSVVLVAPQRSAVRRPCHASSAGPPVVWMSR